MRTHGSVLARLRAAGYITFPAFSGRSRMRWACGVSLVCSFAQTAARPQQRCIIDCHGVPSVRSPQATKCVCVLHRASQWSCDLLLSLFPPPLLSAPILLDVTVSLDCFAMLRSASFAPSRHRAGGATTREQLCTRCVDTEAAWRCKQGDAERSLSSWMRAWSR